MTKEHDFNRVKEELKARVKLEELVAKSSKLIASTQGYKACCPLPGHNEKTASFTINSSENFFYCYGCQRGGDIFTFIELTEGLSFFEALKQLAEEFHVELPKRTDSKFTSSTPYKKNNTKTYLELLERSAVYFNHILVNSELPESKEVRDYLLNRGINKNFINKYKLGYLPQSDQSFAKKLKEIDRLTEATELGLIRQNYQKSYYSFFAGRLMIPVENSRGKVIAFSGRSLKAVSEGNPKYKNSPESLVFKKKKELYGFHQALPLMREKRYAVLVEGFFDQWALHSHGIPSVAVMGTGISEEQIKKLERSVDQLIFLLDNDEAGKRATLRSLPIALTTSKLELKVFSSLEGKDPDEWLKSINPQTTNIEDEILNAQEAKIWWAFEILKKAQKTKLSPIKCLEQLREVAAFIKNNVELKWFSQNIAPMLNLSARDIALELRKYARSSPQNSPPQYQEEQFQNQSTPLAPRPLQLSELSDRDQLCLRLLSSLAQHKGNLKIPGGSSKILDLFKNSIFEAISALFTAPESSEQFNCEAFFNFMENELRNYSKFSKIYAEFIKLRMESASVALDSIQILKEMRFWELKIQVDELRHTIKKKKSLLERESASNSTESARLLQEIQELSMRRIQLEKSINVG